MINLVSVIIDGVLCFCFDNILMNMFAVCSFAEPITDLFNYKIVQIACGASHSMAITEWGQLYIWGSNSRGQLANNYMFVKFSAIPMLVKTLATKHVVQIASGRYHSFALTNSNVLFLFFECPFLT